MSQAVTPDPSVPASAPDRHARHFATDHLMGDLKGRSVRGGAVTLSAQGVKFVLQLGSTAVLARLLTPADFGLIMMVTAITGFVAMFKDAGLSMATVQRAEVNHAQVSTLFWINVALSVLVMLVVAALAPLIAAFYSEPRLVWVTLILATTMVFGGLTVQHQALLKRQMRFKALAAIEIATMAGGIAVAIAMAWQGFGYWALVGNFVAMAVINAAMVWMLSGWMPGLPRRGVGSMSMLKFGGNVTGFNFVNYFSRNADNVLIAFFWGAGPLGLYSKAYSLMMLPVINLRGPLNAVALPAMSRLQSEPVRYRNYYRKLVSINAFLTMPLAAALFLISDHIIMLVLGQGWEAAGDIFRALALACFIQPSAGLRGLVLLSANKSDRFLRLGIAVAVLTVPAFAIGVYWGPVGVAMAYAIVNYLMLHPTLVYSFKDTPVLVSDFYGAVARPAIASAIGFVACLWSSVLSSGMPMLIDCVLTVVIYTLLYISAFACLPGGVRQLREYYSFFRVLLGRRGGVHAKPVRCTHE